jgi:hypothetical protein
VARSTPRTSDGKTTGTTTKSDGTKRHFIIEEVAEIQEGEAKRIVLQLLKFSDGRLQYRFGYYVLSTKGESKDRWIWGRNTLQIFPEDLALLLKIASERGWYPKPSAA